MLRLRFALLVAVVAVVAHDATNLIGHGVVGYPEALGATSHDGHWLPTPLGGSALLPGAAAVAAAGWWVLRRQLAALSGHMGPDRIAPLVPKALRSVARLFAGTLAVFVLQPMRRIAPLLLAGSLLMLQTPALGHTDLAASDPADGSTVSGPPSEVVVTFEGEVGEGSSFEVTGPDGEPAGEGALDLDVVDRNVLRGDVMVSEPGVYLVAWSVVGEDEHPVEGEVTFTYDPAKETTPDTALRASSKPPVRLIGALLIILAVTIPMRRALRVRS